ncbi:hypothetical protein CHINAEXTREME_06350 [Halobiforma lacisalsi AJ5]|uniref:DUF5305 domain-containing protein n=1 Tax=Natronobacterium lacisalsi AJ5 TaxID=358396 RepID=M0M1L2_NATLA|nr:DUF5305 family protein [Halobiforma lacisalsi]APW97414.1 hypothetical protein CHINAEXTREME_06350 [Halobiforma lacisalsi AJ5]EMA38290.1 hypothetical protein C445_00275 [Halobiforma lacisalsi AJ5]
MQTDTDDATPTEGTARRLKFRALLAEYRTALIVVAVALVLIGAWVTYGAYAAPDEKTEQRLEPAWTATGELSHGATVTESTPVHANGTVLENEPLYYTAITPELEGEFVGGYEADSARNVEVNVTIDLVYRAVDPETETVYWSQREELASASEPDVAPGEDVTAAFAVDVPEVAAEIDEIESDLGASPGTTEIYLAIDREIEGEIEGEYRAASDGYAVDIEYDGSTYSVDDEVGYQEDHGEEYETVVVPATVGPTRTVGGPLLLVLGSVGLAGLALASWQYPEPTPTEREWLAYHEDRERFAAVVTRVRLPPSELEFDSARTGESGDGAADDPDPNPDSGFEFVERGADDHRSAGDEPAPGYATVESLAELAQLGIDVGAAVVFDRRSERYLVRNRGTTYVFEPPSLEAVGSDVGSEGKEEGEQDQERGENPPMDTEEVGDEADSEAAEDLTEDPELVFARATGGGNGDDGRTDADEEAADQRSAIREYADRLRALLDSKLTAGEAEASGGVLEADADDLDGENRDESEAKVDG